VLVGNELVLCIADGFPVAPGYSLVIPQRHGVDGLVLQQPEWNAEEKPLRLRRERLSVHDSIRCWTVEVNSDEAAGQTVLHAHWHLIRGREGDWKEPRGKVR
jgi:ATP adenylyltransferase